jgi:hypothetical protein
LRPANAIDGSAQTRGDDLSIIHRWQFSVKTFFEDALHELEELRT